MSATPDQYAAAALIERMAVGDEGDDRERSRQLILKGGPDAKVAALHALMSATETLAEVSAAINTLGLLR